MFVWGWEGFTLLGVVNVNVGICRKKNTYVGVLFCTVVFLFFFLMNDFFFCLGFWVG